jgi:DinB superfamily
VVTIMTVFTNPASAAGDQARAYIEALLDLLGNQDPVAVLQQTPLSLQQTLDALSQAAIMRPEAPGKWSIGAVIHHLADSDLVWAYRVRMVLAHDRPQLTGYDQDLWANRLHYLDGDAAEALDRLKVLRRCNLGLVQQMSDTDRRRAGLHAERGEETIEHMIRMCAAHDLLHLRQIDRIRRAVSESS